MSEVDVAMPGLPLQCLLHQDFHSPWIVIDECQTLMPSRNCVKCIQGVNSMDPTVLFDKMCYIAWFNCTAERICS